MAKKPQKNLFQKLTALFKNGPVINKKIKRVDTTVAMPDKSKSSGALLFQKSVSPTYSSITSNAYNLSERLTRYQDFCLTGDTLVALSDVSGAMRIDELVARWAAGDRDFWTFSYDEKTKSIVSSKVTGAVCNGRRSIVSVVLDDGSVIKCTPDHRFLLQDRSYVEAKNLRSGTALMRFSRADFATPYRYVQTKTRGWKPEHVLVAEAVAGRLCTPNEHVHHRNFVHRDNSPSNLEIMSSHDHMSLHAKINNLRFSDPVQRAHMSDVMKSRWSESGDLRANLSKTIEKTRESRRANRIAYNKVVKPGKFNAGRKDQIGIQNANADKLLTYQAICDAYQQNDTLVSLANKLGVSTYKVRNRLLWEGYQDFGAFSSTYQNHKVVSVIDNGEFEDVYDIEVKEYNNFALAKYDEKLGAQGIVFVHNCEMEYTAEIAAALDIYADETCSQDGKGKILHIYSDNEKIREILEDLMYNTVNVEFNLRPWTRNLVKYGDLFLYADVHPEHGVINVFPIPVNEIEREENYDKNDPFAVRFRWVSLGNRTLENWEILHFRLLGNDMFLPYGSSLIEPARRIWRQLVLIEDAMLVYRIVRAPERRAFYIDVGNLDAKEVPLYMEEQKKNLRTNQVVDRNSGRVDIRYNPFCFRQDTRIPLLDGRVLAIKDLVEEWKSGRRDQETYTLDLSSGGKLVPGRIIWAGESGVTTKLARITLDDGGIIEVTPDHKMMLRSGEPVKAKDLKPGDSLMPFNVSYSSLHTGVQESIDRSCYEKVFDPSLGMSVYTHRAIASHKYDISFDRNGYLRKRHHVIHHANFNKLDNCSSNLQLMDTVEHSRLHSELGRNNIIAYNKSEKKKLRVSKRNIDRNSVSAMSWYNSSELHTIHNVNRSQAMKRVWSDANLRLQRQSNMTFRWTTDCQSRVIQIVKSLNKFEGLDAFLRRIKSDEQLLHLYKEVNADFKRDIHKSFHKGIVGKFVKKDYADWKSVWAVHNPLVLGRRFVNNVDITLRAIDGANNHSVQSVEFIDTNEVVYNVTIDKHANLAVGGSNSSKGEVDARAVGFVFCFQSVDEDYFLPVRGSDSGTKIDTLAGGQNTAAVEDVAYIQKKLFAALKIPRAYLGYDESLSCVVPETPVDLLDGRTLTLAQIKDELDTNKQLWVYSVDQKTLEMKPGRILWCGPTRKNAELVRVTLDNGMSFDTTPDHKWMLRNGEWCEAGKLLPGVSLMPVYRRHKSLNGGSEYEQVYDPATNKWKWTHRLVVDRTTDVVEVHDSAKIEKNNVVHHRNFNRYDNDPSNLLLMGYETHRDYHAHSLRKIKKLALLEGKYNGLNNGWARKCRSDVEHLMSIQSLVEWCHDNKPKRKLDIIAGYGLTETQFHRLLDENSLTYREFANVNIVGGYKIFRNGVKHPTGRRKTTEAVSVTCPACQHVFESKNATRIYCNAKCYHQFRKLKNNKALLNHKVVLVEFLSERRDTWCMEVADTNTFGLSKSVIISNSKATLAQEDIRFSRTIAAIQRVLLSELNKLAIMHLYACGYDGEELQNFTLRLSNPSTIAQQQKLELWRTKFEIAGSVPEGVLSREFIRKEILELTDKESADIDRARLKEKYVDMTIEAGGEGGDEEGGDLEDLGGDLDLGGGGGGGGSAPEEPEEELPPEENAGEEPEEEEQDVQLITSSDDLTADDVDIKFNAKNVNAPVNVRRHLDNVLYNRSRRRTHGASKTHMPDFGKITATKGDDTFEDPYDHDWMRSVISNPFAESTDNAPRQPSSVRLSPDVVSALLRFREARQEQSLKQSLLREDVVQELLNDIEDE